MRFKQVRNPLQRAWDHMINAADNQLKHMPAYLMGQAAQLRTFITKAKMYRESRPLAVPGMTPSKDEHTILLWVSEAPGGVLASISLPYTLAMSTAYHCVRGAMESHREDQEASHEKEASRLSD